MASDHSYGLARHGLVGTCECRGESGEGRKLIATEQRRTQTRGQIGPIPPRTHQAVQPALGGPSLRRTRIEVPLLHRLRTTSTLIISARSDTTEPQSNC